tara:strand:+ start:6553 stop:6759 length:207 start_codon:yes stop_codon:yes gene_type:complete
MGRNIIDITGHVIGNFEIIEHVHTRYWAVRCTPCGKIVNMQKSNITKNKSCGCQTIYKGRTKKKNENT